MYFCFSKKLITDNQILADIRDQFIMSTRNLRWRTRTSFILGSEKNKPLKFFIISTEDINYYLHAYLSQLKRCLSRIEDNDPIADEVSKFQKLLPIDEVFLEYVNAVSSCFHTMKSLS